MLRLIKGPLRICQFSSKVKKDIKETPKKQRQPHLKLNSIKKEAVAMGSSFPKQWTVEQIQQKLDPAKRAIANIKIIKNRLGEHSGFVMFEFQDNNTMLKFVDTYNDEYLKTGETGDGVQKINVKAFHLKTNEEVRSRDGKNAVKLYNFDYDLTSGDIKKIAEDFGTVTNIIMPSGRRNKSLGEAIIFFDNPKSRTDFVKFADGLPHLGRTLKAVFYQTKPSHQKKQESQKIENPKSMMRETKSLAVQAEKISKNEFETNARPANNSHQQKTMAGQIKKQNSEEDNIKQERK